MKLREIDGRYLTCTECEQRCFGGYSLQIRGDVINLCEKCEGTLYQQHLRVRREKRKRRLRQQAALQIDGNEV